jgi:hypothetical protein
VFSVAVERERLVILQPFNEYSLYGAGNRLQAAIEF